MDGPVWELGAVKGVHLAAPLDMAVAPKKKKLMVNQQKKVINFLAGARRRRNGETAVFGCFLKFEVADSRQTFRAACSRF